MTSFIAPEDQTLAPEGANALNEVTIFAGHTVTFDTQDGAAAKSRLTADGETVSKPADPTRSGYIFGGWYKEADCETPWSFETDTVTADLTLYAKWTPKPVDPPPAAKTHTVRFLDGGTELASFTVREGGKAAPPDEPVKEGYRFAGWHTDPEGTEAFDFETPVTGDLTLYAKWAALPGGEDASSGGGSSSPGGGGGSRPAAPITVEPSEHGTVTSDRTGAAYGGPVTLTVLPDSGYGLESLTVTDSRGYQMRLSSQGGGKYAFTMPGGPVTVRAAFTALEEEQNCPSRAFPDLDAGAWYHEAVDYVLRNGLMGGYGNGRFGPDNVLTRAQFAQILYNQAGRPAVTGGEAFADVPPGAWCADAVAWAAERGIAGGYGDGRFGPDEPVTREQLAVMLWRHAGSPAAAGRELSFSDADRISGYAREALRWAVENGVMSGRGGGVLDPKGLATRAQAAQMLKNFLEG